MKPRTIALTVIGVTVSVLALLNFTLKISDGPMRKKEALKKPIGDHQQVRDRTKTLNAPDSEDPSEDSAKREKNVANANNPSIKQSDPIAKETDTDLDQADIKKINEVAALADQELVKQINVLGSRIDSEKMIEKLENGDLSNEEEREVIQALETFALLGLEQARRKKMVTQPELKDPIFAHKERLKEIRELLEDD